MRGFSGLGNTLYALVGAQNNTTFVRVVMRRWYPFEFQFNDIQNNDGINTILTYTVYTYSGKKKTTVRHRL